MVASISRCPAQTKAAGSLHRTLISDFPSWATGVVIPHGIYDVFENRGHINLGLSHDTTAFACDSFRWYWSEIGRKAYPRASSILWIWSWAISGA